VPGILLLLEGQPRAADTAIEIWGRSGLGGQAASDAAH
jgi:hypothetical protein